MKPRSALCFLLAATFCAGGCSSTAKRAGVASGVGLAGAGAGYALSHGKSQGTRAAATAGGAILGAGAAMLAMGEDEETYQTGYTDGFHAGQGDAVRRQYWQQQNMSRHGALPYGDLYESSKASTQPKVGYVTLPGPREGEGGGVLEPHAITVPVVLPESR